MKRDFQEEYQNYIESDMPDLWSRIEPNLKEKNGKFEEEGKPEEEGKLEEERKQEQEEKQKQAKQAKVIFFLKRAVPAAACLCVLIIGISVMGVSKKSMDMAPMNSASEEPSDTGMAYEAEMEEAADETVEETAAAEEYVMTDENFDDAGVAMNEPAAPADAPSEDMEAENDEAPFSEESVQNLTSKTDQAGGTDNQTQAAVAGSLTETAEGMVEIERAVLLKIAVASEEMKEMGYEYVYTFRLEDGSSLKVYLTNEQCDDIEDNGIEIKRKEAYFLRVYPFKNPDSDGNAESGEALLEKIEKLP